LNYWTQCNPDTKSAINRSIIIIIGGGGGCSSRISSTSVVAVEKLGENAKQTTMML
jgi:hypothetical protein